MSIILCTQEDASDWLSETGLVSRYDDDLGQTAGAAEVSKGDRLLARASSVVAVHLSPRYNTIEFAGSSPPTNTPDFVRHCAAVIFTFFSCGRRNQPVSKMLQAEYERVLEYLTLIRDGKLQLPDVADSYEALPFMSNLTIAGAAHSTKVRVLPHISSGAPPDPDGKRKQFQIPSMDAYPFYF